MKKRYFTLSRKQLAIVCTSLLMSWGNSALAGSATNNIEFSVTFVGGGCEISAIPPIQFNDGNVLLSADIEQGSAATKKVFDLTLINCSGWGLTPAIYVSGQTTTDFGVAMFRDQSASMDANGYGVLLSTPGNASFNGNNNLAISPSKIEAKNWSAETELSSITTVLPITAQLSCGDCHYASRQGGDFKATVTFDFVYE
ncbi:fimbrial protein [Providencia sneebia]|uniref:Putative fimbrial-like protein n=1 Tax=Providencia sneebia DSM 19967 TaxID=1141660 RepID=K8WRU8_9GAMM|nr:fimbrial protein [Providencia sneebia]EKT60167.1 putative fimbrial-like protein [Providencia sneebia DSM 19967]